MADKTILILGAGIGGIVAARELRRHLGTRHRIVIVDRAAVHTFPPSYLWVVMGWRKPEAIQKPLSLLARYGIEVEQAEVQTIEPAGHHVQTDKGRIDWDFLLIALGAECDAGVIPGLAEKSFTFYSLEQALALRRQLSSFTGSKIAIVISRMPYKCPPAPYEAALLIQSYFARRTANDVAVTLYTPEASPISVAGDAVSEAVSNMLASRGISVRTKHALASIDCRTGQLAFENGGSADADLVVSVPPHRLPGAVTRSSLDTGSGWLTVDPATLATAHPGVYAIGDVTSIRVTDGRALPKAGTFAHNQAEIVAYNIAQAIELQGASKAFDGSGFCFLETGNGRAAYLHGNYYSEPPQVTLHEPSVAYHWGKVVFEKYWLWRWF